MCSCSSSRRWKKIWFAQDIGHLYWDTDDNWIWRFQLLKRLNRFIIPDSDVFLSIDSRQLTLDLNTVNKRLRLSESNRVITNTGTVQSYPDHPDRFDGGRCCVERVWVDAVTGSWSGVEKKCLYQCHIRASAGRDWVMSVFGSHDQSWSLFCTPQILILAQKRRDSSPCKAISSRIGVFVDHGAGTLSFYSVSDTMSLIHTVQTTFTQPLYPGFFIGSGSSVKLRWWIKTDWREILPIMLWAAW